MDENGDGQISKEELNHYLDKVLKRKVSAFRKRRERMEAPTLYSPFQVPESEVAALLNSLDSDHSGTIDYLELLQVGADQGVE